MTDAAHTTMPPPDALRQRVDEFVGLFFYGTLLKGAREGRLTDAEFGMGGRGEQAFGAQLDLELADRIGRATHNDLGEAIYRHLKRSSHADSGPPVGTSLPGAAGSTDRSRPGPLPRLTRELAAGQYSHGDPTPPTIDLRH